MAQARHKSKSLLRWRRRQKPGSIMKPSTFRAIERRAAAAGYVNPRAVAGKAYWTTVKARKRRATKHRKSR